MIFCKTDSVGVLTSRILAALIAILSGFATVRGADFGRVMPLGDSITDGWVVNGGYRDPLYQQLTADGHSFLFVGTENARSTALLTAAGQQYHQGEPGWVISMGAGRDGLYEYITGWMTSTNPDVIMLMIGTNDCNLNYDIPNIGTRLDALVERIFTNNPSVWLLLATVTPSSNPSTEANIATLNAQIPTIVNNHKALGRNIQLVLMHDALNTSTDLYDSLHPNSQGYAKMATVWYNALTNPDFIPVLSLFQDCDYGGWQADFEVGSYTLSDIVAAGGLDNDASSVKILPGYKVTFYDGDNSTGASLVKTADDTCLVDDGWDERVSSMVVEVDPGMIGHWQFNDNSGSVAGDSSGYGLDGQLVNMDSTAWTAGKHCGGLSFDGVDDYVQISDYKGVTGSASRTCTAWIKTTQSTLGEVVTWGTLDTGAKWCVGLKNNVLSVRVQGGNIFGSTAINDGQWHHVAVTWDPGTDALLSHAKLYVDGAEETISSGTDIAIDTAASEDVHIGNFQTGSYFQGLIDDVRIYNYGLDAAAIQDIYQQYALVADIEPDGDVDLNDFAALASSWQLGSCQADLTCDCVVNIDDLMVLIDEWLDFI